MRTNATNTATAAANSSASLTTAAPTRRLCGCVRFRDARPARSSFASDYEHAEDVSAVWSTLTTSETNDVWHATDTNAFSASSSPRSSSTLGLGAISARASPPPLTARARRTASIATASRRLDRLGLPCAPLLALLGDHFRLLNACELGGGACAHGTRLQLPPHQC